MFDSTTSRPGLLSPTVDGCDVLFDEAWCCWLSIVCGSRRTQVGFDPLRSAYDSEGFKLVFLWFVYFISFFVVSPERLEMVSPYFVLQILFVLF